jgi:hypothetical protein
MKQEMLGGILVAAIIVFVVMTLTGPGTKIGNGWQYLIGKDASNPNVQQSSSSNVSGGSSVVGSPSLSAQRIDQILCNAGSPACSTGQDLYNLGVQYNIDPAFALAVFFNESNFGKSGIAASTRSLGNLRCIPDAACWNGYATFDSWQDSYSAFYKLISGPIYVGSGLTTPESILPKYAPSGDHNDPSHYIAVVERSIQNWRQS